MKEASSSVQELHRLQEEHTRVHTEAVQKLQAKDEELKQLKLTLSRGIQPAPGQADWEARIHALTENVVQKQSRIESLSAENTSLMLQLETERGRKGSVAIPVPPSQSTGQQGRMMIFFWLLCYGPIGCQSVSLF